LAQTAVQLTAVALVAVPAVQPVGKATQTPVVAYKVYPELQTRQTVALVHVQHPVPQAVAHPEIAFDNKYPELHEVHWFGKAPRPVHEAQPAGAGAVQAVWETAR